MASIFMGVAGGLQNVSSEGLAGWAFETLPIVTTRSTGAGVVCRIPDRPEIRLDPDLGGELLHVNRREEVSFCIMG